MIEKQLIQVVEVKVAEIQDDWPVFSIAITSYPPLRHITWLYPKMLIFT